MELLVYKASAGSGKTFTLAVEYIKHLILNPRAYRQILAVTFTNKATAEMKERILQQLYGIWVSDPASSPYLNRIREDLQRKNLPEDDIRLAAGTALQYMLHDYSRFRVETIDSFFQSVMRNLARELELSPNLNIELNNTEVLSDAVDSLIEKLTPSSPVLAWLLDYINERIADDKRWNVSNEIKRFGWNIFDEGYIEQGEGLRQQLKDPNTIKLYRNELREMETEALEQMKGFYDQFIGELEAESSGRMHSVFLFLSSDIAIYTQHMLRFRPVPYTSANPTYFFSFAPLFSLYSSFSSRILRSSSASVLVSDFFLVNASRKFFRDPWYSFSTRFSVHCPISSSSVIAG